MNHCWSFEIIDMIKTSAAWPELNFTSLQFYLLKDQSMRATWCHRTHLCLCGRESGGVYHFVVQGGVKFEILAERGSWKTRHWECKLLNVRFYLGCLGILSIWSDLDRDRSRYHKLRYFFNWRWFGRFGDRSSHVFAWCWGAFACWAILSQRSTPSALLLSASESNIVFCVSLVYRAQKLLSDDCGFLG